MVGYKIFLEKGGSVPYTLVTGGGGGKGRKLGPGKRYQTLMEDDLCSNLIST